MTDAVIDTTEKIIDDPDLDKAVIDDPDKVSTDRDDAQSAVDLMLEKHNFASLEDLESALESGQTLKDMIGDRDAIKLVRDAETLAEHEQNWAKEDRLKLMDEETPEESIARLTKEISEKDAQLKSRDTADADAKKLEKRIRNFEKAITSEVDKEKLPKDLEKFLGIFTGLKHPVNSIQLDDLAGAANHAKSQVKLLRELEQVVIRRYIDGKAAVIDVPETDTTDAPVDKGKKVDNLDQARKILHERVTNLFKKKA